MPRLSEENHFPKNSKNRLVQDRNVRAAYHDGIITLIHVQSAGFATDLNAKPSGPTDSTSKRATLLQSTGTTHFTANIYIIVLSLVLTSMLLI